MQAVSHRMVLVIDGDAAFRDRLATLLAPFGVRVEAVEGEDAILEAVARRAPEAVFIAVDLPEKEGYGLFSRIKQARRRVPVVLVTSSISASDLKLHEKLKVHAEAYLDKRTATDEEIRNAIESGLGIAPSDEASSPREEPAVEIVASEKETIEPWLAELLDPETAAILAEIHEDASLSEASRRRTAPGDVSPERMVELEEELELLREELDHARRDARSSPFSSEFLVLREEASAKDKRSRALQEALGRRDSQFGVVKARLTELARLLLEARKEADGSREQASDLKSELEAAQGKLQRLFDEVEQHERKLDDDAKGLRHELLELQARHTETRRKHDAEVASLKSAHAKAAEVRESEHQSEIEALEKKLKEQKSQLADELKSKYGEKLKELQASHGRALASLREEKEGEAQSIHDSYREAAIRAAEEAKEVLRQAAEKSAAALEGANLQRLAELARAEETRKADLSETDQRRRDELQALEQKHRSEKEALAKQAQAAQARIERISTEFGAKVQDVVKGLEEERARHQETRERYEQELESLQTAHSKHVEKAEEDQFSALAGLSRKFREDRTRFMEIERLKWEDTARILHLDHARALEGLEQQFRDEAAALAASYEAALRQRDAETEQTRKAEIEKARAQIQEGFEKTLKGHADELARLRQDQEKEVSSLRATHMEALQKRDRESQQALRDAVETARADASQRADRAREEAAEALAGQRREHEEEITAFETAHLATVAKLDQEAREDLRRAEEERDEAREGAVALRAQLAELEARERSNATVADERHKSELREAAKEFKARIQKLEEEKQFLSASVEKLKRQSSTELTRSLDSLAHEKTLHQGSKDRYERRLAELSLRHIEGIKEIEKDWLQKFELLERSFNEKSEKAVAGLERDWRARIESERFGHEEAKAALTRHFEMELATVRQQFERTRGIEESYQAAARDLTAIKRKGRRDGPESGRGPQRDRRPRPRASGPDAAAIGEREDHRLAQSGDRRFLEVGRGLHARPRRIGPDHLVAQGGDRRFLSGRGGGAEELATSFSDQPSAWPPPN